MMVGTCPLLLGAFVLLVWQAGGPRDLSGILVSTGWPLLLIAIFWAVGLYGLWMAIRVHHTEAEIWTFDRAGCSFTISKQIRNRITQATVIRLVAVYPLPLPGSVRMHARGWELEDGEELEVLVNGRPIRGMGNSWRRARLRELARQVDAFLPG
jgi:hypothetical protein